MGRPSNELTTTRPAAFLPLPLPLPLPPSAPGVPSEVVGFVSFPLQVYESPLITPSLLSLSNALQSNCSVD